MADVEEEVPAEEPTYEEPEPEAAPEDVEDDLVVAGGASDVKLFGKWSYDEIHVRDISLVVS